MVTTTKRVMLVKKKWYKIQFYTTLLLFLLYLGFFIYMILNYFAYSFVTIDNIVSVHSIVTPDSLNPSQLTADVTGHVLTQASMLYYSFPIFLNTGVVILLILIFLIMSSLEKLQTYKA